MSELTIDAARDWVTHYRNSASITLPPKQAIDALEFVLANLDASELHNSLLRKALNKWKAYFQSDIPKTRDEHEQSGEAFTDAWFEMEQALGTDGGKEAERLRAKLAAAEHNAEVYEKENVQLRKDYIKTSAKLAAAEARHNKFAERERELILKQKELENTVRCAEAELKALREDSPTRPYVIAFAKRMEAKLAVNRHKGDREGWLKDEPWSLVERVLDETVEMQECFTIGSDGRVDFDDAEKLANECADVANFCMMVADCATATDSARSQNK